MSPQSGYAQNDAPGPSTDCSESANGPENRRSRIQVLVDEKFSEMYVEILRESTTKNFAPHVNRAVVGCLDNRNCSIDAVYCRCEEAAFGPFF